ncbi:hypothetical protein ABH942_001214 [Flavobacterium sp. 28YEA47A]
MPGGAVQLKRGLTNLNCKFVLKIYKMTQYYGHTFY